MVYWRPQDYSNLARVRIRDLSTPAPVPVSYSGFFQLSQEKLLNISNQVWLFPHFFWSHPSSSELHADRSLRSCITPERVWGCRADRGICLGKAGWCYRRMRASQVIYKTNLGGCLFSLKGNAPSCKCRLISTFAEGAQFPRISLVAVLHMTQYFSENPWNLFR